jgi:Amt family ammonium transporter
MRRKLLTGAGLVGAFTLLTASPAFAQDEASVDSVKALLDNVWILVAAVLVIFMQAGFALVEAGLTRGKNVGNIMLKNLIDFCAGVLAFVAIGFAIAYGPGNDFMGTEGWFLSSSTFGEGFGTLTTPTFFVFQVAFAATAATIVSGAMAERTKFKSYLVYSFVISALIYPVVVHWIWGGGWLFNLDTPFIDFAGSTAVHSVGGWAALMGALILGPRIGKYDENGKPRAILGHSIPFALVGVFILLVGWFGFNPGSMLAADLAIGAIAFTTVIAAAAGAITSMATIWLTSGKPDVAMEGNGVLAGLVGVTAGCYAMDGWGAFITGAIAGVLVVFSVMFFDRIRIDDPVGAISVHGICGVWGTLAVGLFATEGGLLYGDGADQLVTQAIGVVAVAAWVLTTSGILFLAIKSTIGLRVSPEEEIEGLDVHEHGSPGYGPDTLAGASAGI